MDGGEVANNNNNNDDDGDLDSFFREKDRRKKERLAKKMAAKQEQLPVNSWMLPEEEQSQQLENARTEEQQAAEENNVEDLATKLQYQTVHRPEDDEWIDPEREFGTTVQSKRHGKSHNANLAQQQDDKLLLLVAPSAHKLQDLSAIPHGIDKSSKSKQTAAGANAGGASTGRGWSKISEVEVVPIVPVPSSEPTTAAVSEPSPAADNKVDAENVVRVEDVAAASSEPAAYVIRQKRSDGVAPSSPAAGRSPRTLSPVSKPPSSASASASAATEPGVYIAPHLRRHQQPPPQQQQQAPSSGPSRPAGSGLAVQPKQQAPKKVMPDLKSADEFPSLG